MMPFMSFCGAAVSILLAIASVRWYRRRLDLKRLDLQRRMEKAIAEVIAAMPSPHDMKSFIVHRDQILREHAVTERDAKDYIAQVAKAVVSLSERVSKLPVGQLPDSSEQEHLPGFVEWALILLPQQRRIDSMMDIWDFYPEWIAEKGRLSAHCMCVCMVTLALGGSLLDVLERVATIVGKARGAR